MDEGSSHAHGSTLEAELAAERALLDGLTRIAPLLTSELDADRLMQRLTEEATRLTSHLEQFRALMAAREPSGRRMDFLVQEMHREVNTTGSKSQHPEISNLIDSMKAELERIREQVQNVE